MQKFLRQWHRWIGFPATLFLLLASTTGIWLAGVEFFGEEETLREQTRDLVSTVTTQSADADLASALAKARAAVVAKVGAAPVNSIAWQFKGDAPTITFFLGKPTGGEDRKVVCDAHDGHVLKVEDYTDKSFMLRLHSGEVFGDGGLVLAMFWGLALLLLTLSGILIYFKMRRPNAIGWKKVFWLFALLGADRSPVRADSPFYTDDPNFSPGWEIKMGFTSENNTGGTNLAEVLDWNYAIVPNVRLNLTTYTKDIWPEGGGHEFGYGDTEFKIKWRIQDEDEKTGSIAWGIAPKIIFPTADVDRGLGDGVWRFQVPVQFGKTVGKWYHFGEAGYQWAFDSSATDLIYGGAGTLYNFTPHWALGTELFSFVPADNTSEWQLLTTAGLIYTFNANWAIKTSISHTLRDVDHGGPNPSAVFYAVWNF
jgi:hypothetical protein